MPGTTGGSFVLSQIAFAARRAGTAHAITLPASSTRGTITKVIPSCGVMPKRKVEIDRARTYDAAKPTSIPAAAIASPSRTTIATRSPEYGAASATRSQVLQSGPHEPPISTNQQVLRQKDERHRARDEWRRDGQPFLFATNMIDPSVIGKSFGGC